MIVKDQQQKGCKQGVDIKKCEFRESLTQKVKKRLFMYSLKLKQLDTKKWFYNHEKYVKENWDKLMPYVKVGICESVQIIKDNCPGAILSLSNTSFPYLKRLLIINCQIVNIEALEFLDAQNLQYLNLVNNRITNFKSLSKLNFSNLKSLLLGQNEQNQFCYDRIKLSKKSEIVYDECIINFSLYYEDDIEYPLPKCHEYRQDYSKIAKLEAQSVVFKRYANPSRIPQAKVNFVINDKYSNFKNYSQGIILLCGGRR